MVDGEKYVTVQDCAKVLCGFSYYCNTKRSWENTDGAKTCKYNTKKKQED